MRYPTIPIHPTPPAYPTSLLVPPGASIVNNMMIARFHKGPSALTYIWFYGMVRLHGPWDYKSLSGRQYADYGNFNYGAVGTAAGISEQILLRGAGWAQSRSGNGDPQKFGTWYESAPYGDDPADQVWIRAGIDYAKRTGF
ncbi:TPA: hypothetical protein NHV44_003472 [Enterobacter cloacae]|nr:polymorphic toxin type 44 domain-containing protein [Enterobacter cloacae]MBZ5211239.1 hypothetical protein [Enterobacter cloacae subsp. cloacae]HAS1201924.1 hypothetical protein [Enterobacter cloacae]HAS1442671.1 hypothetical protein [Enterobacter cloacae]HAS1681919.1 hypothetical protein [Enterobacter cloacae]HBM7657708.1 hypothetical protein [Enterobacter cloacae subsp. cloacae]